METRKAKSVSAPLAAAEPVVVEVQHSPNFTKVNTYYGNFLNGVKPNWTKQMVYNVVGKWITAEEYQEITGEAYEA